MKNTYDDDQPLSLDPEENLRMENQLTELKLNAEFGAKTFLGDDIPENIKRIFLKNVMEYENKISQAEETTIFEILGSQPFQSEASLEDDQVRQSLQEVTDMLLLKNIVIDFGGSYDSRTKYKFITEELFEESILHAGVPGMIMHFIYEEFHPDHKADLESKARKFIAAWFEKDVDKLLWELTDHLIISEGITLSKEKVKEKFHNTFERYTRFSECKYVLGDINFEASDDSGIACTEGIVSYNALMENTEAIAIQGCFKLYFTLEYGWWDICFFVMPGFDYDCQA
jgi:hypothetical protein